MIYQSILGGDFCITPYDILKFQWHGWLASQGKLLAQPTLGWMFSAISYSCGTPPIAWPGAICQPQQAGRI
jgi:hypothetical protein